MNIFQTKNILRRFNIALARVGPYRFVTRRYFGTDNIAMTSRLLEVEAFREDILPQPLPIGAFRRILLLAPHQDDETIGAGGTLLLARDAGAEISIVYCTDGGQYGIESKVRRNEARQVCGKLGATMFELNISNIDPKPTIEDLKRLNEIVREVNPDLIMCPWLLDGAPKHRMVNHVLWLANRVSSLPDVEVWGYQVQNTLLPNGFVNITEVAEQKRELLRCFVSQNSDRHWDHVSMGLAAWNSRLLSKSANPRYAEIFLALPVRELLMLIERFYFPEFATTYHGEPTVAKTFEALHRSVIEA